MTFLFPGLALPEYTGDMIDNPLYNLSKSLDNLTELEKIFSRILLLNFVFIYFEELLNVYETVSGLHIIK